MAGHPRVGVFLCECGGEISNRIDLEELTERARVHPSVVSVRTRPFWCSPEGLSDLRTLVGEEGLDRIVVAGCSPRTHGHLLRSTAEEAGLNWNFCEIVNLRDHCARVHPDQRPAATAKAGRLLLAGLAAARESEPVEKTEAEITPLVAVVGGGIAGMTAALALARRDIAVRLIEREADLGGYLARLGRLYPSHVDAAEFLRPRVEAVEGSEKIEILRDAEVVAFQGHTGAFEMTVGRRGQEERLTAGAVIVATGAEEWIPETGWEPESVISLTELEGRLRAGFSADRITLVLSSEGPTSRSPFSIGLAAEAGLECARTIEELRPGVAVSVLFRELPTDLRKEAQSLAASGVRFLRYDPEDPPQVTATGVEVREAGREQRVTVESELTAVATGLVPSAGTREIGKILALWQDPDGFLIEPCVRLRPEEVLDRGIYVAGTAHGPAGVTASMAQALGAAARALELVRAGTIEKRAVVAVVDEEVCRGCGRCEEVCAFGAARLVPRERGVRTSHIDEILCVGCGVCASECISGAIRLPYFTDRQLRSVVAAVSKGA